MTSLTAHPAAKLLKYELRDLFRGRWLLAYALFFLAVTEALFRFGGTGGQVLLSLTNLVLILIPLVCTVFGTVYVYHTRAFTELMLTQPVKRSHLFAGLYGGLAVSLSVGFLAGTTLPFALHGVGAGHGRALAVLAGSGVLLTLVFLALAVWTALRFEDRMKGLGTAIGVWLFFALIYDGLVLLVVNAFAAYPLERPLLALTFMNPVDLARVLLLLHLDVSALLGYTGAVFERFFGGAWGTALTAGALAVWVLVPLGLALRRFERKDF